MIKIHTPVYIEYTGWYNACAVNNLNAQSFKVSKKNFQITCKKCLKILEKSANNSPIQRKPLTNPSLGVKLKYGKNNDTSKRNEGSNG